MNSYGDVCLFPTDLKMGEGFSGKSAKLLNQEMLRVVHDFYYHEEIGIDSAVRMLNNETMQGGVEMVWGDVVTLRTSAEEQTKVQSLIVVALDWKKMFGFCPIRRILPKEKGEHARFEIPEFGTGAFFMVYDNQTRESELKFMPYRYGDKHKGRDNHRSPDAIRKATKQGKQALDSSRMQFPKNYFVYVWPRFKPSLHNGFLKTPVSKLLRHWSVVKQLESNLLINDTWRSMPPVVTKRQLVNQKLEDLTEEEIFGEEELIQPDPLLQKKYQRDLASHENTQDKSRGFRSMREKTGASQMVSFNTSTGRFEIDTLKHPLDPDNIFDLEEGMQVERLDQTTTSTMYLNLKHDYEDLLDRTFGVDRGSRSSSSSGSRLKATAEKNRQLLETLVAEERSCAALFYATAYEFVYREHDNWKLAEIRASIDDELELATLKKELKQEEESNKSRIADLQLQKKRLEELAKQDLRLKLKFPKNPFGKLIDPQTVNLLIQEKVLTPLEEINMLRAIGNFEPLEKDNKLVVEREKLRKLEETQKEEEFMISPLEQAEAAMSKGVAPKKRKAEGAKDKDASDSKKKK